MRMKRGRRINEERRKEVTELYSTGLSQQAVADKLGVSRQAVQMLLKRLGVPVRPRGGANGGGRR
jgi:hypothetical protein